jgi:hypothetical protein
MISGYVWILPAATTVGWILSWWGSRRLRWGLLAAAVVVSVLCLVISYQTRGTPISPDSDCRPAFQCMDWDPIYWVEAGLIGLGCIIVLVVVTVVVEAINKLVRSSAARRSV